MSDPDAEGGFRQVSLDTYLRHVDNGLQAEVDPRPQVAVVVAAGEISGGEKPQGEIGGESTAALLQKGGFLDDEFVEKITKWL